MIVLFIIIVALIVVALELIIKEFWIVFAIGIVSAIVLFVVVWLSDNSKNNGQNKKQNYVRNKKQNPIQSKKQDEPTTYEMDHLLSSVDEMLTFDLLNEQRKKLQRLQNNKKRDYTEYWETHCESCDEFLEDCECDWERQSKQDVSQSDSGFGTHGGNDFEK